MTALTDDQLDRYARHILLREIGGVGQRRLLEAKVLVIGAGGIGAPALLYLAAAGIGTLGIVDFDVVSLSNLQRQILYGTGDVGTSKLRAAAHRLGALDPATALHLHDGRLTAENADEIIAPYDLVLDGCDNFETRFAVSDACVRLSKPLVSAAIGEFDGQIAVFRPDGKALPCYRCFVAEAPEGAATCTEQGVVGALAGVIGTWAALEVVKEIAGFGTSLAGHLVLFDGLAAESRKIRLKRDPGCAVCAGVAG